VREVRALLLAIPPLVADLIRLVVGPRLARSGVALTIVAASDPPPDLVIATESANLPVGIPAIVLSADLALILGGGTPTTLTPDSLADKLLELI
jgi:hypothetical protein